MPNNMGFTLFAKSTPTEKFALDVTGQWKQTLDILDHSHLTSTRELAKLTRHVIQAIKRTESSNHLFVHRNVK
jgi:hypothetical protein